MRPIFRAGYAVQLAYRQNLLHGRVHALRLRGKKVAGSRAASSFGRSIRRYPAYRDWRDKCANRARKAVRQRLNMRGVYLEARARLAVLSRKRPFYAQLAKGKR
ncbi:hypothetical protein MRX96_018932 [Rhipicephalus microplus]